MLYEPCHTEVGDGSVTAIVNIDILRTYVPMEDIILMGCGKTMCYIKDNVYLVQLLEGLDTEFSL